MVERQLDIGTPEDHYRLVYCREKEIAQILEYFKISPIVFLYAAAGNGKSTFGVEFRERIPGVAMILAAQLGDRRLNPKGLWDKNFDKANIIIVDEFGDPFEKGRERIDKLILQGKKFVFMQHYPKSRFIKYREQHQVYDKITMGLIRDYPDAPWIHLAKYKEPKDTK